MLGVLEALRLLLNRYGLLVHGRRLVLFVGVLDRGFGGLVEGAVVHAVYLVYHRRLPFLSERVAITFDIQFVTGEIHCLHWIKAMHSKATVTHLLPFKDAQELLLIMSWELEELDEVCLVGEVGLD